MRLDPEEHLRARVGRELGSPVADAVWDYLVEHELVGEALEFPDQFAILVAEADHLAALSRDSGTPRRRSRQATPAQDRPLFSEDEQQRAEAVHVYFARLAWADREVRGFRRDVLGRLFSDAEARD